MQPLSKESLSTPRGQANSTATATTPTAQKTREPEPFLPSTSGRGRYFSFYFLVIATYSHLHGIERLFNTYRAWKDYRAGKVLLVADFAALAVETICNYYLAVLLAIIVVATLKSTEARRLKQIRPSGRSPGQGPSESSLQSPGHFTGWSLAARRQIFVVSVLVLYTTAHGAQLVASSSRAWTHWNAGEGDQLVNAVKLTAKSLLVYSTTYLLGIMAAIGIWG